MDDFSVKYPDCEVQLTGTDGNAFSIIGTVRGALRDHLRNDLGLSYPETENELADFADEAMSSDYDNVLITAMKWVTVH